MKTKKLIFFTFLLCFTLNLAAQDEKFVMPKFAVGINYENFEVEQSIYGGMKAPFSRITFAFQPNEHLRIEPYFGTYLSLRDGNFGYQKSSNIIGFGFSGMFQHKFLNFSYGFDASYTKIIEKYPKYYSNIQINSATIFCFSLAYQIGVEYFVRNNFSIGYGIGIRFYGNRYGNFYNNQNVNLNLKTYSVLNMRYHFPMKDAN